MALLLMVMASSWPPGVVWAFSSPVAMAYVYFAVMRLPRGWPRLVASLPVMAFYVRAGFGFATVFERGVYSFFFIWLTSFKIALLCWDHGPAADPWAIASFARFLALMNLSLQIRRQKFTERFKIESTPSRTIRASSNGTSDVVVVAPYDGVSSSTTTRHRISLQTSPVNGTSSTTPSSSHHVQAKDDGRRKGLGCIALLQAVEASQETPTVVARLLFKFVFLWLIISSYRYRDAMHVVVVSLVYSFEIYVACSLIFEGIAAVVSPLIGIELEAAFDKPFLSHSLANFWGKRWNLLVSNLLRVSIHDPLLRILMRSDRSRPGLQEQSQENVTSGSPSPYTSHRVPLWVRSVASFACFLASGLMHELIFYNITRSKPTWEVTFFFVLNGAATILEGVLRQKTTLKIPKVLSIPLTLSFILGTAILYFYPPLVNSGAVDDSIAEFQYFYKHLHEMVGGS